MKPAISQDIKRITEPDPCECYQAINRLMHYQKQQKQIGDLIESLNPQGQQVEFRVFIASNAVAGEIRSIPEKWGRFHQCGWLKKEFLENACAIGENYWPHHFYLLAEALYCDDDLMATELGIKQLKHYALVKIADYLNQYGTCLLEYFEQAARQNLLSLLKNNQLYLEEAVLLAKYYCRKMDSEILNTLYQLLPNAGKASVVTLQVYNQNSAKMKRKVIENTLDLPVDQLIYSDKTLEDYRDEKQKGMKSCAKLTFLPTGKVNKSELLEAIKIIESRS